MGKNKVVSNKKNVKKSNNKKKLKALRLFKEIRMELKKVVWPTKDQLINNTLTVLAVCVLVGAIIWIADFAFLELSTAVFK